MHTDYSRFWPVNWRPQDAKLSNELTPTYVLGNDAYSNSHHMGPEYRDLRPSCFRMEMHR